MKKTGLSRCKNGAYISWRSAHQRCEDPNHSDYKYYGAKGIKVCERWSGHHGFEHFLEDMGMRPEGATLDRIGPTKNYSKSNCRWSSHHIQAVGREANKRKKRAQQFRKCFKNVSF